MTAAFKSLLKKKDTLDKFREAAKAQSGGFEKDPTEWQPTVDEAGNGYAIIRFLPPPPVDGDDGLPWNKRYEHAFKGPTGKWYIELSLTTLGQQDPVSEHNTKLWNSGVDSNKKLASAQKRKLRYVSNIVVVKDPKHPENDGKTFKYWYGKKIFDKIDAAMNPSQEEIDNEDAKPIDPFHFLEGANFKLKIRKYEGQRNYDKSEFEEQSALFGGDEKKLEELWNSLPSLKAFTEPSQFKDYATLKQRLDAVLGFDTSGANATGTPAAQEEATTPAVTARTAEGAVLTDDDDPALFDKIGE